MRSSIYKQTPEYINDLYAEANRNNINDLEELESNEALKELVKLSKYKNLLISEMLDYGGGKITKEYEGILKTNYLLSQDELLSSVTKNMDLLKHAGTGYELIIYTEEVIDIVKDSSLTVNQKWHKGLIETGTTAIDFGGGVFADGVAGFTGPAAPYVAVAGNVLISVKIENWRKDYYEEHNLQ